MPSYHGESSLSVNQQPTNFRLNYQANLYVRMAARMTGKLVDQEKWKKQQADNKKLKEQTKVIATKLESVGISCYNSQDVAICGGDSRIVKEITNYRNINFFPEVAQKNRSKLCKDLNYFIQRNPKARMLTITTGVRCTQKELKYRCQKFHRLISRANSLPVMKDFGAKVEFRTTELGEIVPLANGEISVHPHMHLVYTLERKLTRGRWNKFLKSLHSYFGTNLSDDGFIKTAREFVKYCVKPNDLDELNAVQLKKLYESTQGIRLTEALHEFRNLRSSLQESKDKIVCIDGIFQRLPTWHTGGKKVPRPKVVDDPDEDWITDDDAESNSVGAAVIAWLPPSSALQPVTEPIFLVRGIRAMKEIDPDFDTDSIFELPEVRETLSFINVHTSTLTVQEENQNLSLKTKINPQIYENESSVRKESTFT